MFYIYVYMLYYYILYIYITLFPDVNVLMRTNQKILINILYYKLYY